MQQKFLTEPVGLDKRSQMFKYLIGEKPNFECHGEWPVPSIQFFYGTWAFELELIVYPVCLPGQTSSSKLIAVSLPGSPFLSLYVLIRLTIKDGTEASADVNKARGMPGLVRIKSVHRERSCSECEYGGCVVRVGEWQKEGAMKLRPPYWTRQGELTADWALIRTWRPDPAGNILIEVNGSSVWLRIVLYYIARYIICVSPEPTCPNSVCNCAVLCLIKKKNKIYFLALFCNQNREKQSMPMFAHPVSGTTWNKANIAWTLLSSRHYYSNLIRFLSDIPNLSTYSPLNFIFFHIPYS